MREIKFKGRRIDNGEWVYGWYTKKEISNLIVPVIERYREWDTGDYIESIEIIPETVSQFTGLHDKNGIEIYEGDIITFWLCYPTIQTHTGDNIPGGSYTEPDETQLVKVKGQVVYDEDLAQFTWGLIGKRPYQMDNAFSFLIFDNNILPIVGRNYYNIYDIKDAFNYYRDPSDFSDDEFLEIIKDYGFESESDLMCVINDLEVVGNVHANPDML